ncbi:MAG: Ser/Thr and Tyr protein phosphatase [Acidobacteria bacterium]|nr:Ser/Thr and Tyr protein phosphatase [Acidobacteriota bacterium]
MTWYARGLGLLSQPPVPEQGTGEATPRFWPSLRTYLVWSLWVSIAFFSIYPTCNWAGSLRSHTFGLYLSAELSIPLVPEMVWVYLSMYVLFLTPPFVLGKEAMKRLGRRLIVGTLLAGAVFLAVPTHLGFPRELPSGPLLRAIYEKIFAVDLPHNMVPSLHVVYSALFLLAFIAEGSRKGLAPLWGLWLVLISSSTVLVHQHHLLDVVSGLGLAVFLHLRLPQEATHAPSPASDSRCGVSDRSSPGRGSGPRDS